MKKKIVNFDLFLNINVAIAVFTTGISVGLIIGYIVWG